ncbi:MAG: RDD family protein [Desulfuromonadales bacterium]|nr:RDD family protein [Desulfuromonadales bacterium]
MLLTCPHCGFSREIPEEQTTTTAPVNVQCPGCHEIFVFDPLQSNAPGGEEAPVVPDFVFTPRAVAEADLPKAGFWIRAAAAFVDSLISGALQGIILFLFAGLLSLLLHGYDSDSMVMVALAWLLGSSVAAVYYVYFTAFGGQTPGKMALRIKVVRTDNTALTLGRAFYREIIGKFVSGIILGIGYLMIAFDAKKQGLHDRMAETYVVRLDGRK